VRLKGARLFQPPDGMTSDFLSPPSAVPSRQQLS